MVGPTDEQLDEIEARLDAATPGPWTLRVIDGSNVVTAGEYPMRSIIGPNRADLGFIANAPSDLRLLLAAVRRGRRIEAAAAAIFDSPYPLDEQIDKLRAALDGA